MSRSQRALCRDLAQVTPECPVELTTYGYYPNLTVNAFFVALFGLLCISQIGLGSFRRTWTYMLAMVLATFGEAVGYGGRLMMNKNPWDSDGFKMQICCLVLAPSFVAAGIYLTLKHLVLYCGPEHSRLKPRLYPWIFIGFDFGSIVLQAIGGGIAAAAGDRAANPQLLDVGNGLIVAGIATQVATMAVCALLMLDFFLRFRKARKARSRSNGEYSSEWEKNSADSKVRRNFRIFCASIAAAFLTTFIRCIYRLPEMAGGWGGELMRRENEFLILDGMCVCQHESFGYTLTILRMIGIACTLMTVIHPGFFFPPMRNFKK